MSDGVEVAVWPQAYVDSHDLVTVASDILGPVALDSDGVFNGPGAGCFTVLSPAPAEAAAAIARVAPRLLNVDDQGIEHPDSAAADTSGAYTQRCRTVARSGGRGTPEEEQSSWS